MKKYTLLKYTWVVLGAIIVLGSCTRRDLLMRPDDGYLKIRLDWKGYKEPQSTAYYFYNSKGDPPIYRLGTSKGFEGYLPAETYKVVIFNTDMRGADVVNTNSYHEDHVIARELFTRAGTNYIQHVENVFATGITNVIVPPRHTAAERIAQPENFVKSLTCIIHPAGVRNIKSMEIDLGGAVKSKYHVTNLPVADKTGNLLGNAEYQPQTDTYKARISTLGFMGESDLEITVYYTDDSKQTTLPVSLTEEFKDFPEDDKTVEITLVLPDGKEMMMNVIIHGWKNGVSGGGVVD